MAAPSSRANPSPPPSSRTPSPSSRPSATHGIAPLATARTSSSAARTSTSDTNSPCSALTHTPSALPSASDTISAAASACAEFGTCHSISSDESSPASGTHPHPSHGRAAAAGCVRSRRGSERRSEGPASEACAATAERSARRLGTCGSRAGPPHRTACASSLSSQTSSPSDRARSLPLGHSSRLKKAGRVRRMAGSGRASTAAAKWAPTCLDAWMSDERGSSAKTDPSSSSNRGGESCAQNSAAVARH
eukprot:scaffold5702_cov89-Isochrysis_galbana.AAC.2